MVVIRTPSPSLLEPRVTTERPTEEPWSKPESALTVTVPATTTQVRDREMYFKGMAMRVREMQNIVDICANIFANMRLCAAMRIANFGAWPSLISCHDSGSIFSYKL